MYGRGANVDDADHLGVLGLVFHVVSQRREDRVPREANHHQSENLQGQLAHKKTHLPKTLSWPMPRVPGGS